MRRIGQGHVGHLQPGCVIRFWFEDWRLPIRTIRFVSSHPHDIHLDDVGRDVSDRLYPRARLTTLRRDKLTGEDPKVERMEQRCYVYTVPKALAEASGPLTLSLHNHGVVPVRVALVSEVEESD